MTNSPVAKLCRRAAALHIISARITTDIFKPCYLHETSEANEAIKGILHQQSLDEKKQRIVRALLLLYPAEVVDKTIVRTVKNTADEVVRILSPILGNQTENFRTELIEVLHKAVNLWRKTQRSGEMVEASTQKDGYNGWKTIREFGNFDKPSDMPKPPHGPDHLNLFPYVYILSNGRDIPIYPGLVLWSDQKVVIAAEEECRRSVLKESRDRERDNEMVSVNDSSLNETHFPGGSP